MNYRKLNNIIGWGIFVFAAIVFVSTIEPTASLWDCGEYIATANKLEVGHPPGAPLFMLLGRIFSAFVAPESAAMMVNVLSALSSAFAILFIFWSITMLVKKIATRVVSELDSPKIIAIFGSGAVGAMALTFTDSFWFSAVEGEVYAMSAMFTAATFWAILKWEMVADEPRSNRWLVLIAYLIGLSIGVHLLSLLVIPAMTFVYYFKKYKPTKKGMIYSLVIGFILLVFVQNFIIPGIVKLAAFFELELVNGLGMPFNSGALVFALIITGLIVYGLHITFKKGKVLWNTAILCFTMLLIGYSTFALIMIRSNANTPIDENNPENLVSLLAYLNREQYGDWPIFYGPYFNSPRDYQNPADDGSPVYTPVYSVMQGDVSLKDYTTKLEAEKYNADNGNKYTIKNRYFITDDRKGTIPNYDPAYCTYFPRMYSGTDPSKVKGYKSWSGYAAALKNGDVSNRKSFTDQRTGKMDYLPTFWENLKFFWNYQVEWMYWRYFMWNFSGRQNDTQGHGALLEGNWISGVNFIDNERLGPQELVPQSITSNRGYNKFYMLPLLLGLIGFLFQLIKAPKDFTVVFLLFALTGLMIIVYLNQKPFEPRERDYAYVGSFMAFTIWIGLGVYALFDAARSITLAQLKKITGYVAGVVAFVFIIDSLKGEGHAFSYSLLYLGILSLLFMSVMFFIGKKMQKGMITAILPVIIGLSASLVMAKDGWNDHDRSGRYTARDLAKNYLDSCDPNAILFTNGDNDTFPLWYVQEVEGYRTDVRVCNLSLLSTDWYITDMKRKAYDSEPVPFGLTEPMYRQGTRDFVELHTDPQGRYIDIKNAMQFVYGDENTTLSKYTGDQEHYFPTKKFILKVDKDKVLRNGIVNAEDSDKIVDEIRWTLPGGYVMKNTLMVLDLLANFNWDRPIYFASTTGSEAYAGLQDYFQLEGFAYKLVPIKTQENSNPMLYGRVDTDKMYENLMNKFSWEGLNTPGVHLSYYDLRMTGNYRIQFNNLADALVSEGQSLEAQALSLRQLDSLGLDSLSMDNSINESKAKKLNEDAQKKYDMAENLLDYCIEILPEQNAPYTTNMIFMIETYHKLGAMEKAHNITERLADIFLDDLTYYSAMSPEKQANLGNNAYDRTVQGLGNILDYLVQEEDKDLANSVINKLTANVPRIEQENPRLGLILLESQYKLNQEDAADNRANGFMQYFINRINQLYNDPSASNSSDADKFVMEQFRWVNTIMQMVDNYSTNDSLKNDFKNMVDELRAKEMQRQKKKMGQPMPGQ